MFKSSTNSASGVGSSVVRAVLTLAVLAILTGTANAGTTYVWNGSTWTPAVDPVVTLTDDTIFQIGSGGTPPTLTGISGDFNITKTGDGTLILTGDNDAFTCGTKVLSGTLQIAGPDSIATDSIENAVSGNGALLKSTSYLRIGTNDTGSLKISGGGVATAASHIYIGQNAEANGTITVDGSGSGLNGGGTLIVGNRGTGALEITAGGKAALVSTITLGSYGSGTALVDGNGSELSGSMLVVGDRNTGALRITGGGKTGVGGAVYIGGYDTRCGGGTVTIDGATSELTTTNRIFVDYSDKGALNLTNVISVSGNANVDNGKIDLASLKKGTYTIMTAAAIAGTIVTADFTVGGAAQNNRYAASFDNTDATKLVLTLAADNKSLT